MSSLRDNLEKCKDIIEFAIKNKYIIKINYTDEIDCDEKNINWKYPPYLLKNYFINMVIDEIITYFKNFENMLIIMNFEKNDFIHKIPLNLPIKKLNKELN